MRSKAAACPVVRHSLLAVATVMVVSALIGAASLQAKIVVTRTVTSFRPPGGCNIGAGGQPLVHHESCTCTKVVRSSLDTVTGNTWSDTSLTCADIVTPFGRTVYSGFESLEPPATLFKQQPVRFLNCKDGFADLTDSSGTRFEPVGPCSGGDWTAQLPEKSVEVRMNGLHSPAVNDCEVAKASFLANFKQNVPLKNLCKSRDATAVPASILRMECAAGTKANGFVSGSVLSVVVTCQGS